MEAQWKDRKNIYIYIDMRISNASVGLILEGNEMENVYKYLEWIAACKRKEDQTVIPNSNPAPKKPRLVFTDIQRRTLQAIFRVSFHLFTEINIYEISLLKRRSKFSFISS